MQSKLLLTLLALLVTAGCGTTSYVLVGSRRPPISSDEVIVYWSPPPAVFEEVAILDANTKQSWTFTEQSQMDIVMGRLKGIAASLGANGILFQGASNEYAGSVAFGNTSFHRNSILSIAGAIPLSAKVGHGVAIYVAPGSSAAAASVPTIAQAPQPVPRVVGARSPSGTCPSLGADLTKLAITSLGGMDGVTGAMISRVLPNSAAAAAGIRKGDIVIRVGDSPIDNPDDVHNAICSVPAGSIIDIKVSRESRPIWLSIQF